MRLINSHDADNREALMKLEQNARQASALIAQHEATIRAMQDFAIIGGIPKEHVAKINPVAYCHEALSSFAIEKLKE